MRWLYYPLLRVQAPCKNPFTFHSNLIMFIEFTTLRETTNYCISFISMQAFSLNAWNLLFICILEICEIAPIIRRISMEIAAHTFQLYGACIIICPLHRPRTTFWEERMLPVDKIMKPTLNKCNFTYRYIKHRLNDF